MAFGNPYEDEWSPEIVAEQAQQLIEDYGVNILSMSDTIGSSTPESIKAIFGALIGKFEGVEFGAHLHTTHDTWEEKIKATINAGCTRIDTAIKGYGGCPMAKDDLTGNMPTENVIHYINNNHLIHGLNEAEFRKGYEMSNEIFS